jgi:hypothetical protein
LTSASTGLRARFVLRPFDDDDVIAHIRGEAVMRAADDPEESVGNLLRCCRHSRGSCRIPNLIRHGDIDERVRLHGADGEVERRMAALRLNDTRGELDTTEVAITGVRRDDRHVTQNIVR